MEVHKKYLRNRREIEILGRSFEEEIIKTGIRKNEIKRNDWNKLLYKRMNVVFRKNKAMYSFVSIRNHEIHGNWHDVFNNYLRISGSEFSLNLYGPHPRTSELIVTSTVCLYALRKFLEGTKGSPRKMQIQNRLKTLDKKLQKIAKTHFKKIQNKHGVM